MHHSLSPIHLSYYTCLPTAITALDAWSSVVKPRRHLPISLMEKRHAPCAFLSLFGSPYKVPHITEIQT